MKKYLLYVFIFSLSSFIKGQSCSNCDVIVSTSNNTSYTVSSNQIFCIDSIGKYTGTITLNGGVICNKGVFKPQLITIITGTLNNYSYFSINNSFKVNKGFVYNAEKKSFTKINNNLNVCGGVFINKGISNVKNNFSFTSGTITNQGILNCNAISTGTNTYINTGIINHD